MKNPHKEEFIKLNKAYKNKLTNQLKSAKIITSKTN